MMRDGGQPDSVECYHWRGGLGRTAARARGKHWRQIPVHSAQI